MYRLLCSLVAVLQVTACDSSPAGSKRAPSQSKGEQPAAKSTPSPPPESKTGAPDTTKKLPGTPESKTDVPDGTKKVPTISPEQGLSELRYTHRTCSECEEMLATTCVRQTHPGGRVEELGCGQASSKGSFAVIRRESGSVDDGTWILDYIYHGPSGILSTQERACTEEPGFDCEGPGRFLALKDDSWMQQMGNSGSGTNDQKVVNLVSKKSFELPSGEYEVVEHAGGRVVGFFAQNPNVYDEQEDLPVKVTMGCLDTGSGKVHVVWTKRMSVDSSDSYSGADAQWSGDKLVVRSVDDKVLKQALCPPKA